MMISAAPRIRGFVAGWMIAFSVPLAAKATDLPRVDLTKPVQKDIGRNLECCDGPKADLRLLTLGGDHGGNGMPNTGFCGNVVPPNHSVVFSVINLGSATTTSTTALVDFGVWGRIDVAIPPLAPGGSSRGYAIIPSQSLRHGDQISRFQISVDPGNAIAETNEGNNMARSYCRNTLPRTGNDR